jgi:hypothetical protein
MSVSSPHEFDFGATLKLSTREDVAPGSRRLEGCYVYDDEAEARFVPSESFLGQPPLWRIDVLQDLMYDFELLRRHAIVESACTSAIASASAAPIGCITPSRSRARRGCSRSATRASAKPVSPDIVTPSQRPPPQQLWRHSGSQ